MQEDREHLHILSIFHYVVAGISGLFACFPIFHLIMGISMLTGGLGQMAGDDAVFGWTFGLMFTLIPLVIILLGWAFAIALAYAGRSLVQYKNYTFCLVMAGLACMFMPFGTVLGIFTILVLLRPSVKALFGYPVSEVTSP